MQCWTVIDIDFAYLMNDMSGMLKNSDLHPRVYDQVALSQKYLAEWKTRYHEQFSKVCEKVFSLGGLTEGCFLSLT